MLLFQCRRVLLGVSLSLSASLCLSLPLSLSLSLSLGLSLSLSRAEHVRVHGMGGRWAIEAKRLTWSAAHA